jgi:hypothetical protein
LDAGPLSRLQAQAKSDMARHLVVLSLLAKLAPALDAAGAAWVVVKGPALTELAYGGVARGYIDLDLVVGSDQFGLVMDVLAGEGARPINRNWELLLKQARAEVQLNAGRDLDIDLHWHLVNIGSARRRFRLPMRDCLGRRQHVALAAVGAWVLEPTDSLAHVALHSALSGGHRLLWLVDIDRTVARASPDWDALVQRCRSWRVGLPVAATLNRARHVLGTPVPDGVVDELSGGRSRRILVECLRDWTPNGRLPGGGSIGRAVTRSLRDGPAATTVEVTKNGWAMARRQWDPHKYWLDPDDRRHVLFSAGGPDGLSRYLDFVVRTDRYGQASATVGSRGRQPSGPSS